MKAAEGIQLVYKYDIKEVPSEYVAMWGDRMVYRVSPASRPVNRVSPASRPVNAYEPMQDMGRAWLDFAQVKLDDESKILDFYNKYGLLASYGGPLPAAGEPINWFRNESLIFRCSLGLYRAYKLHKDGGSIASLRDAFKDLEQRYLDNDEAARELFDLCIDYLDYDKDKYEGGFYPPRNDDERLQATGYILRGIINERIAGLSYRLEPGLIVTGRHYGIEYSHEDNSHEDINNLFVPTWKFANLLEAIYLKFRDMVIGGKDIKECKNTQCRRLFIPKRKNEDYCDKHCKGRAKRSRYYAKYKK